MSRPQDNAHNERKLKPIYDYLDNGYYKKSMQEIDKLLKKNKDWPYLKVLKALACIRMNRKNEGIEMLNSVCNDAPYDDSTLQTMTICFRDLNKPEMIPTIYENALKKDPTSEKLFTHLFMAHVRVCDYKKQQLTALNLYRVHTKNAYYFWAVMSIYTQAITASDEAMASKITLPLAEKMCQKFYNDNKFESEQEVELYLMILEKQQKFKEMIEVIDKTLEKRLLFDALGFVKHRKVQLLKREGRLHEAFTGLVALIRQNSDQYEYYSELFHLATSLDALPEAEGDLKFAMEFFALLDEMCNRNRILNWQSSLEEGADDSALPKGKIRGPVIAKILLSHLIQTTAASGTTESSANCSYYSKIVDKIEGLKNAEYVVDLIYEYFLQFGSKFVCVKDIIFMLQQTQLSQTLITSLLVKMSLSLINLDKETTLEDVNRTLCYRYLKYFNCDLTANSQQECSSEIANLISLHKTVRKLEDEAKTNKSSDDTNNAGDKMATKSTQPFDAIVYLLANQVSSGLDIYNSESFNCPNNDESTAISKNSSNLLSLSVLLESALTYNSYDFYSKLLLVRLYNSFGASSSSHAIYETLDIKLIQNDTLGHFFLPAFLTTGLYSHAQQFLNASSKFYTYHFKEASDLIINLYKYGAFTKIEQIISFNYKLRHSVQYRFTFIEKLFLNLLVDCKNRDSFSTLANDCITQILNGQFNVEWSELTDNRDIGLLSSNHHQLHLHITNTLKEKTNTDEILWLRYRFALMQNLALANYIFEKQLSDDSTQEKGDKHENNVTDTSKVDIDKLSLDSFAQLVEQIGELSSVVKSAIKTSVKYCLEGPAPSRINQYFKNQQYQCIIKLLNYLVGIFKYHSKTETEALTTLSLDFTNECAEFTAKLDALQSGPSKLSIFNIREALEDITNWIETSSICISLLDVAFNTLQIISKTIKKSKKKKTADSSQNEQVFAVFNERLSACRDILEETLKRLVSFIDKESTALDVTSSFRIIKELDIENHKELQATVEKKLTTSYNKSFSELSAVLQAKLKYISSLRTFVQPQQQQV